MNTTLLSSSRLDSISALLQEWDGADLLITGGTGVIGQATVRLLDSACKNGGSRLRVRLLSRTNSVASYIPQFMDYSHESFDLTDGKNSRHLGKADLVIHGATYGQPAKFELDKIGTMKLNSTSLIDLLESGPSRFLFLSSSEIYSGLTGTATEDQVGSTNTNHNRAAYIESKRFGEAATLAMHSLLRKANVARIALAYGPGYRSDDERLLYKLITRGLQEHNVYLMDGGSALRTYCYADDTADMLLNILLKGRGEIYNVGGLNTISVRNLGQIIAQYLGVSFRTPHLEEGSYTSGPSEVRLDISKTLELAGKTEFVDLEQGLAEVVRYAKSIGIG